MPVTVAASITGVIAIAAISIDVLRARFTLQPSLKNCAGSQPPAMLPIVAMVYTTTIGAPRSDVDNPYCECKNFGSQNMMNHQMGSVMNLPIKKAQVCGYFSKFTHGTFVSGSR